MSGVRQAETLTDLQDAIGYIMRRNIYTLLCLCYRMPDTSTQVRSQILDVLQKGLDALISAFPWLAGVVSGSEDYDRPTILSSDRKCQLIIKDLIEDDAVASMDTLEKARFPYSMVTANVFTPVATFPADWKVEPCPVFALQVNFIKGGLVLGFASEHTAVDGAGLGHIINMLSRACHDQPFTPDELAQGNRARTDIIPLLDRATYTPGPELENFLVKQGNAPGFAGSTTPPDLRIAYYYFSATSLATLKARAAAASSSVSDSPAVPYTTTNDAVTAFIWRCATRMRLSRLPPDAVSMFVRAVDARPCLAVPAIYPGNLNHQTYTKLPVSSVVGSPLSEVASALRRSLDPRKLAYEMRSLATSLTYSTREDRAAKISYGSSFQRSTDMWFSSWSRLDVYGVDFDMGLGLPVAARKPFLDMAEGLMFLMPMDREGGLCASVCLTSEEMETLRADPEWCEVAEFVG